MPVKNFPLPALEDPRFRFCLLAYRPREESETPSPEDKSILLLIEQAHRVQVFVDPNWRKGVKTDDHEFIEELIADFKQRCQQFEPASVRLNSPNNNRRRIECRIGASILSF
jgi:hypothetical protein